MCRWYKTEMGIAIQTDLDRLERNGSTETPGENAKCCTWREITLQATTGWGLSSWKAALTKKHLECLEDEQTMSQQPQFTAEFTFYNSFQQFPCLHQEECCQQPGRFHPYSLLRSDERHLECKVQSSPAQVRHEHIGVSTAKDHKDSDDWNIPHWRKGWESCVEKSQGDLM